MPKSVLRVDRRRLAELADAVALRHHDLAVLDDGERDAGHLEGLHRALHDRVEIRGAAGWRARALPERSEERDEDQHGFHERPIVADPAEVAD